MTQETLPPSSTLPASSIGKGDWIENFLAATKDVNSPEIFRRWAAIATLSGALERRVFTYFGSGKVFPNTFIVLVAPPRVGKTKALEQTSHLWRSTKVLHVAPDSISSAALIDCLESTYRALPVVQTGEVLEYHSLQIVQDEMGVLLPEYAPGTLSLVSALYDCKERFTEEKRTNKLKKDIINPIISVAVGATPGYLKDTLPEVAWDQGFMARMIIIYQKEGPNYSIRGKFRRSRQLGLFPSEMKDYLKELCELVGAFQWTEDAEEAIARWHEQGFAPAPTHPRLANYCNERMIHVMKLSMISSISRGTSLRITLKDFERARAWMIEAEGTMPDVFAAMGGKGDKNIILDLHQFLLNIQKRSGTPRVRDQLMYHHLSGQVQSERIPKLVEQASRMGLLKIVPPNFVEVLEPSGAVYKEMEE